MIVRFKILSFCFLILCYTAISQAQNAPDSLMQKSFDYLENQFWDNSENTEIVSPYANAFLKKAKQEKIDSLIQVAYFHKAYISDFENAISYCDSIISLGGKSKKPNHMALLAYNEKAWLYYDNSDYKEALKAYLIARKIAKKRGNKRLFFMSNYSIGIIKSLIGQKEEAFTIFKDQYRNFKSDSLKNQFPDIYLSSLISLSDSFTKLKKLDSASYYNKFGVRESLALQKMEHYPIFVLHEGINLFEKGAYQQSADSISKATSLIVKNKDSFYLVSAYLNSAKISMKLNGADEANKLLKKADTVILKTKSVLPEYSRVYELLYANSKKSDSTEIQLLYLEKLIAYNKKLEEKFDGIDLTLYKQYDTPVLIESKEKMIVALEEKNKANRRDIYFLSIFLAVFCLLSFYYYRKRFVYKKRYDKLIHHNLSAVSQEEVSKAKNKTVKIPDEILEKLLPKITEFEKNQNFLESTMTLNKMAKLLDSNTNYLSKTINHIKQKNFSSYLSDLRIDYAIQELKTNPTLLNYTIKAIASEVGFGNAESFTKAFYAKTNLYPSYFIKQLKKER